MLRLFAVFAAAAAGSGPPPYVLFAERKTYADARAACMAAGRDLASVRTALEWKALLYVDSKLGARPHHYFWVGIDKRASKAWVNAADGSQPYLKWGPHEPNNGNGEKGHEEQCVNVAVWPKTHKYGMNDYGCAKKAGFMCGRPSIPTAPIPPPLPSDKWGRICPLTCSITHGGAVKITSVQHVKEPKRFVLAGHSCKKSATTLGVCECKCKWAPRAARTPSPTPLPTPSPTPYTGPVGGGWSQWGSWSGCTKTCGSSGGERMRERFCDHPRPKRGGHKCSGEGHQKGRCKTPLCAVHGGWSGWGEWTTCTEPCGTGEQLRERLCDNPAPSHGGAGCTGKKISMSLCNTHKCPEGLKGILAHHLARLGANADLEQLRREAHSVPP